jgi:HTH-type transcriptional regulator/antitoxin HigA
MSNTITIKPIHTKADHAAALKEIECLWDAKPGTPEHDKLDVLATLVVAYEKKHTPMLPPDPIEAIKFRIEQQGKTRKDLEPIIGTRASRLSRDQAKSVHTGRSSLNFVAVCRHV